MVKDVNRLREQWRTAKRAHDHETNLTQKREELENHIQQLSFDLNQKELAAHRLQDYSPDQAKTLLNEIDRKQNILNEMTDKKRQIDTLLDTYEISESHEQLKQELASAILERSPEKKDKYHFLINQIRADRKELDNANEAVRLLSQIHTLLTEAWEQRKGMRWRGILNYLFGVNPYYVITQRLQAMALLIKNHIAFFEKDHEVSDFLIKLKTDAEKRWGYRHLDQFLPTSQRTLNDFIERYQQIVNESNGNLTTFEAKLDQWLLSE